MIDWLKLIGGFVCFTVGVYILYKVIKHPIPKEKDFLASNLNGYISGSGFIILGLILIVESF